MTGRLDLKMIVEPCTEKSVSDWLMLRQELWPHATGKHPFEIQAILENPKKMSGFLVRTENNIAVAFAEASLRYEYVSGCETSPVAYLEGIYVKPEWRKQGVARLLCDAVESWGISAGCRELASDTEIENVNSQNMHAALGFEETDRIVFFRKALNRNNR